jgi:hypothetical protein
MMNLGQPVVHATASRTKKSRPQSVNVTRERLEDLMLVRVAVAPKREGLRASALERSLAPYVRHVFTSSEWRAEVTRLLDKLVESGDLERKPLRVTDAGRRRALAILGVDALPAGLRWSDVRRAYLPVKALGLSPRADRVRRRVADADGLRAALLSKRHGLEFEVPPTLTRAIDSLVWRRLGVETDEPLTLSKVRAKVLADLIGADTRLDLERTKRLLTAEAAGASSADADALRTALIRTWLAAEDERASDREDFDLASFARAVHEAARAPGAERFGDDEVFISSIWRELTKRKPELDLPAFKRRLLEAHRAGLVRLERADLVQVMNPVTVRESEIEYLNATFHFVCLESGRPS